MSSSNSLEFSDFSHPENPDRLVQAVLAPAAFVKGKFCSFPTDADKRRPEIKRTVDVPAPADERWPRILDTLAALGVTSAHGQVVAVTAEPDDSGRILHAWVSASGKIDSEQHQKIIQFFKLVWHLLGKWKSAIQHNRIQVHPPDQHSPPVEPEIATVLIQRALVWKIAVHGWNRWATELNKGLPKFAKFMDGIDSVVATLFPEPPHQLPQQSQSFGAGPSAGNSEVQSRGEGIDLASEEVTEPAADSESDVIDSQDDEAEFEGGIWGPSKRKAPRTTGFSQEGNDEQLLMATVVVKLRRLLADLQSLQRFFARDPREIIASDSNFDGHLEELVLEGVWRTVTDLLARHRTRLIKLSSQYNITRKPPAGKIDLIRFIKKKMNLGQHFSRLSAWAHSSRMGHYLDYKLSAIPISDESNALPILTEDAVKESLKAALGPNQAATPVEERHIVDGALNSPSAPHVHAEVIQIDFHARRAQDSLRPIKVLRYIGISKLSCYCCEKYFTTTNSLADIQGARTVKFYTRGFHTKVYTNSMVSLKLPAIFLEQNLHQKLSSAFVSDFQVYYPKLVKIGQPTGSNPRSDDSAASGTSYIQTRATLRDDEDRAKLFMELESF